MWLWLTQVKNPIKIGWPKGKRQKDNSDAHDTIRGFKQSQKEGRQEFALM